MAYGNMSQAEKRINKSDLNAYKNFDQTNHSMIPGVKLTSELSKKSETIQQSSQNNSPKKSLDLKLKENTDKLMHYGAVHLGPNVSTLEPKMYLG